MRREQGIERQEVAGIVVHEEQATLGGGGHVPSVFATRRRCRAAIFANGTTVSTASPHPASPSAGDQPITFRSTIDLQPAADATDRWAAAPSSAPERPANIFGSRAHAPHGVDEHLLRHSEHPHPTKDDVVLGDVDAVWFGIVRVPQAVWHGHGLTDFSRLSNRRRQGGFAVCTERPASVGAPKKRSCTRVRALYRRPAWSADCTATQDGHRWPASPTARVQRPAFAAETGRW
jgi:hypothetical protein